MRARGLGFRLRLDGLSAQFLNGLLLRDLGSRALRVWDILVSNASAP